MTLNRNTAPIRMRNYGRIIQDMIQVATEEQDSVMRQKMILYIAQCMRQKNLVWNKDQDTSSARIREDIIRLSDGCLSCDFTEFDETMQRPLPKADKNPAQKKQDKKK